MEVIYSTEGERLCNSTVALVFIEEKDRDGYI